MVDLVQAQDYLDAWAKHYYGPKYFKVLFPDREHEAGFEDIRIKPQDGSTAKTPILKKNDHPASLTNLTPIPRPNDQQATLISTALGLADKPGRRTTSNNTANKKDRQARGNDTPSTVQKGGQLTTPSLNQDTDPPIPDMYSIGMYCKSITALFGVFDTANIPGLDHNHADHGFCANFLEIIFTNCGAADADLHEMRKYWAKHARRTLANQLSINRAGKAETPETKKDVTDNAYHFGYIFLDQGVEIWEMRYMPRITPLTRSRSQAATSSYKNGSKKLFADASIRPPPSSESYRVRFLCRFYLNVPANISFFTQCHQSIMRWGQLKHCVMYMNNVFGLLEGKSQEERQKAAMTDKQGEDYWSQSKLYTSIFTSTKFELVEAA